MIKQLYTLIILISILSCKEKNPYKKSYDIRSDIRFGKKFFSICISEDGTAYAIKGVGSHYLEPLKVESSDTSKIFKLDSIEVFLKNLDHMKDNPIIKPFRLDSPRGEVYYKQKKVYDDYKWDDFFWNLFNPIMRQIPAEFNPFRGDTHPFG